MHAARSRVGVAMLTRRARASATHAGESGQERVEVGIRVGHAPTIHVA